MDIHILQHNWEKMVILKKRLTIGFLYRNGQENISETAGVTEHWVKEKTAEFMIVLSLLSHGCELKAIQNEEELK